MALLGAAARLLLALALAGEAQPLCSPTAFYKNCWIRRFPGLRVDLRESRRRGGRLLQGYSELSAQRCGRACCLRSNVSCNLAVFYHGATHQSMNCLHMSCPALESCILKAGVDVVLYNITTGIDPDLLVFEKLKPKEPNAHSSLGKSERQHSTETPQWGRCHHHNTTMSASTLLQALPATTSHGSPVNTYTPSTSLAAQKTEVTAYSRAETFPGHDHFAKRTSTRSVSSSDQTGHPALLSQPAEALSHVPTPPLVNSSKQHSNETKGSSGRNSTAEKEAPAWEAAALGVWLIPAVLCCSLLCLCSCTAALSAGRCGCRRGHYKPLRTRRVSGQLIKPAAGKGSL
ncbi:MANS4 protein, partial [Atrichornis clamosus]|nr:MANS4 protein [Atrichornis clamosus]